MLKSHPRAVCGGHQGLHAMHLGGPSLRAGVGWVLSSGSPGASQPSCQQSERVPVGSASFSARGGRVFVSQKREASPQFHL